MAELVTRADLAATEQQLRVALDYLGLRLAIRLGAMLAVAIAASHDHQALNRPLPWFEGTHRRPFPLTETQARYDVLEGSLNFL